MLEVLSFNKKEYVTVAGRPTGGADNMRHPLKIREPPRDERSIVCGYDVLIICTKIKCFYKVIEPRLV